MQDMSTLLRHQYTMIKDKTEMQIQVRKVKDAVIGQSTSHSGWLQASC